MSGNTRSVRGSDENSRASKTDTPAEEATGKRKSEGSGSKDISILPREINLHKIGKKEIDQSCPSTSGLLGRRKLLTEMPGGLRSDHDGHAVNATRSRKRTRAGRYPSDITYEELAQHFHLPSNEACREIGLGLTAFKSVCRKFGLAMWPYKRPRKSHMCWLQEQHAAPADHRKENSDIEAMGFSHVHRISGARFDSGTVQHGLTQAKPDKSQVEQVQTLGSEQCKAVPSAISGLKSNMLKEILKYRDRRLARRPPDSLTPEQQKQDSMPNSSRLHRSSFTERPGSDVPSDNTPVTDMEMMHHDVVDARKDSKQQLPSGSVSGKEWTTTSGRYTHGSPHSRYINERAKTPEVELYSRNQKTMIDQDMCPRSMDQNVLLKLSQMIYLWNVLMLLDSIQTDDADAAS